MAKRRLARGRLLKTALFLTATASLAVAQTRITAPKNRYTPAQDVELGHRAAAEVEQQLPLLRDDGITSFVDRIGRRLVQVTPAELQYQADLLGVQLMARAGYLPLDLMHMFYCIAVVPQGESQAYQRTFQRVVQSIRLTDES